MKILFVTYSRAMFGANLCMLTLIKDLRDRYNVEAYVILPEMHDGDLEDALKKENIPYTDSYAKAWVVAEGQKLRLLRGLKYSYSSHKNAKELADKLRRENFDLVYSNNSSIQFGADIAKKLGIPHIWHIREFGLRDYGTVYSYPKFAVVNKFKQAAKVITISKELDNYIHSTLSDSIDTKVVYDGIESDILEKTSFDRKSGICNFVMVGVLRDSKNQLELLKTGLKLVEEGTTNFHIHIIGNGEEYEKQLNAYVQENKLDTYVTFHGFKDNVNEMLKDMDAGVICSKSEAFGRVTVEYMLASLPVIGAAGAGTSEIIEDGKTGYLYKSGDVEDLKKYMNKIILDEETSKKLGIAGRKRALECFSAKRNTDEIYKIMEGII